MSLVKRFLNSRGEVTASTVAYYRRILLEYVQFNDGHEDVTEDKLNEFLAGQKCKGNGKHAKLRALKAYTNFLIEEDLMEPIRFPKVKMLKPYRPCPSQAEVIRLLESVTNTRDRALFLLVTDSGLRRSEAANLLWADVDLTKSELVVRQPKNGEDRAVPFQTSARHALREWQAIAPKTPTVFGLKVAGVQQVLRRLNKRTGSHMGYDALR